MGSVSDLELRSPIDDRSTIEDESLDAMLVADYVWSDDRAMIVRQTVY